MLSAGSLHNHHPIPFTSPVFLRTWGLRKDWGPPLILRASLTQPLPRVHCQREEPGYVAAPPHSLDWVSMWRAQPEQLYKEFLVLSAHLLLVISHIHFCFPWLISSRSAAFYVLFLLSNFNLRATRKGRSLDTEELLYITGRILSYQVLLAQASVTEPTIS